MRPSRAPEAHQGRRVEVIVTEDGPGTKEVLLRDMAYGPGVGWYAQKTIRLDAAQVDALMRSLCCAKQFCTAARAAARAEPGPGPGRGQIVRLSRFEQPGRSG